MGSNRLPYTHCVPYMCLNRMRSLGYVVQSAGTLLPLASNPLHCLSSAIIVRGNVHQ